MDHDKTDIPEGCEENTPYIGVNPHLDPQVVERVGTVLVQSFMLLLPVAVNWFLQRFLKKIVDPKLAPLIPKANVSNSLSSPPAPVKERLREE